MRRIKRPSKKIDHSNSKEALHPIKLHRQSHNKVVANCKQTNTKTEKEASSQSTVGQPSVNRRSTISEPSVKPLANRQSTVGQPSAGNLVYNPTVGQPSAKPSVKPLANRRPTVSQPSAKPSVDIDLDSITGKKLKFLNIIFNQCKISGGLETNPIVNDIFQSILNTSTGGIRSLIWELKKERLLDYKTLKKGRVGLRRYILPKNIYDKLLITETVSQPSANRWPTVGQTVSETVGQPSAKPSVMPPSSSSYIYNKTTTTPIEKPMDIINIPVCLKELGFTQNHIQQIQTKFTDASPNLQRSLDALAFDIEEQGQTQFFNSKKINNIISWFFGAMKSGGYESSSQGFLSEEEKGEQSMLELLKKRKILKEKNQEKLEALAFEEWVEQTPMKEIEKLVPPGLMDFMEGIHEDMVKSHFVKNEMDKFLKGLQ